MATSQNHVVVGDSSTPLDVPGGLYVNGTQVVNSSGVVQVATSMTFGDGEYIGDTNGNEILKFGVTASAVNELKVTNAATTNNVAVTVTGDTAVGGLAITSKAGGAATVAGGVMSLTGGAGNTTGAGGAASLTGGAGGNDAVGGAASLAGGAAGGGNRAGGAATVTGGAGAGSAAGGAATVTAGAGGATGVGGDATLLAGAGGATSGDGGDAKVTAGAATANNDDGGDVILTPGAAHGTGMAGVVVSRGLVVVPQGAPAAKTTSATLTAAELKTGIITVNQGAGATSDQQLPTAADLDTALPSLAAGDAFDFSVINTSTVDAEDASVTTNTGWTLVGSMDIHAYSAAGSLNSSARFRARKTGSAAWTLYRIS